MKVYMKPIEVIAWFKNDGFPTPIRFRLENEDQSLSVIRLEKVLEKKYDNTAGNKMLVYRCQTSKDDSIIPLELKYEIDTRKWYLFKI